MSGSKTESKHAGWKCNNNNNNWRLTTHTGTISQVHLTDFFFFPQTPWGTITFRIPFHLHLWAQLPPSLLTADVVGGQRLSLLVQPLCITEPGGAAGRNKTCFLVAASDCFGRRARSGAASKIISFSSCFLLQRQRGRQFSGSCRSLLLLPLLLQRLNDCIFSFLACWRKCRLNMSHLTRWKRQINPRGFCEFSIWRLWQRLKGKSQKGDRGNTVALNSKVFINKFLSCKIKLGLIFLFWNRISFWTLECDYSLQMCSELAGRRGGEVFCTCQMWY